MVEQGYNYLDGPIHSMVPFVETKIENLEKSMTSSVPLRNKKKKKNLKKRKAMTLDDPEDEDSDEEQKGRKLCKYISSSRLTTDECTTLKALIKQAKQKKSKYFEKREDTQTREVMAQKKMKIVLKQKKVSVLRNYMYSKK